MRKTQIRTVAGTGPAWAFRVTVAALALAAGRAWAAQDCDVNGETVNPANGATLQGRTGMMRCKHRESGQLVREQELQAGRFVGVERQYVEGKLVREQSVNERGNVHGRVREFAADGQLQRESTYDNGTLVGLARAFHPNGQLQRVAFHTPAAELAFAEFTTRGELQGLRCADRPVLAPVVDDVRLCGFPNRTSQLSFVAENGTVRSRATYVGGKRTRFESFQPNGLPARQEEVTATARIERVFGPDGVRRREVLWAITNGQTVREREQEFAANGAMTRDRRWTQGELTSEDTFYLNGQPRSKAKYTMAGPTRTLETREFHDSGVLAGEGRYIDTGRYAPTPTGTHRQFDTQGRIKSESVFDARGRISRERSWDTAGALLRDDEVFEDGSRKALSAR